MKVETYTNKYGHEKAKCPFCDYESHTRVDKLAGIRRHIFNQAKNEALGLHFDVEHSREHLDYYQKHTSNKKVVVTQQRVFDEDLEV